MAVAKRRNHDDATVDLAPVGYDQDFYSWTQQQAEMLRAGRLSGLDLEHLAEEIEDLGKETFNKLASSYQVILLHMLKWDHQPERRSRSWVASIEVQRLSALDNLDDNPGLKSRRPEALARAYRKAWIKAAAETRKDKETFPPECPYSLDEIMTRDFEWPQR